MTEARLLADRLYTIARDARKPERQAEIFTAMASSLQAKGEVFDPRRDNPPLLAGEQRLPMEYSDNFQFFLLSVWNGIPIHVTGSTGAELNSSAAVPIVDLVGMRLQWGKSRFSDFRLALGLGYTKTTWKEGGAEQAATMPNVSVGLGTFKVGFAWLLNAPSEVHRGDAAHARIIVGVDLLKLISGSNVEAL